MQRESFGRDINYLIIFNESNDGRVTSDRNIINFYYIIYYPDIAMNKHI